MFSAARHYNFGFSALAWLDVTPEDGGVCRIRPLVMYIHLYGLFCPHKPLSAHPCTHSPNNNYFSNETGMTFPKCRLFPES